jgi:hypothetical protein
MSGLNALQAGIVVSQRQFEANVRQASQKPFPGKGVFL